MSMLILRKKDGTAIKVFDNWPEFYRYITAQENAKLLEGHPEFGKSFWSFQVFSPERVAHLINTLKKFYDEAILLEAWNQQLSMVELCEGDLENIRQILVTGKVNVEALREDWCKDYCYAHGMTVTKTEHYFKTDDGE